MTASALPIVWQTAEGVELTMRHIGPRDFELARTFLSSLSYGTRYFRFGHGRFLYPDDEIRRLLEPDPRNSAHLVVIRRLTEGIEMIGSARYVVQSDGQRCEFSIVVLDGCQGLGIGPRLMASLIEVARDRGLRTMTCQVLGTNVRMLAFVRRFGFRLDDASASRPIRRFELALTEPAR
jgi:acetyltransferase